MGHLRFIAFLLLYTISQILFAQDSETFNVKKIVIDTSYKVYYTIKKHKEENKGMMYSYLILFPDNKARTYVSEFSIEKVKFPSFEKFRKSSYACYCTSDTIRFRYPRPSEPNVTMLFLGVIRNKRVDGVLQWSNSRTGKMETSYYNYYPYYGPK